MEDRTRDYGRNFRSDFEMWYIIQRVLSSCAEYRAFPTGVKDLKGISA